MIIRIGLLLAMVIAGFLVVFPEWWDLRDLQRQDKAEQAENAARAKQSAINKAQRKEEKLALFSRGQFPDPKFLSCLLAQGKDRPEQIVNLDCSNKNITDVSGISTLTNLTRLNLSGNRFAELDLTSNVKLNDLVANKSAIDRATLPGEFLRTVDLSGNDLTKFSLSDASRLEIIDLSSNQLTELRLTHCAVRDLWAQNNKLNSISLTKLPKLRSLNLRNNQFSHLELDQLSQLAYIDVSQNPMQNFDIKPVHKLKMLLASNTQLTDDALNSFRKSMPTNATISVHSLSELIYPDPIFRRCVEAHLTNGIASLTKINCDRYKVGLLSRRKVIDNVEGLQYLFALKQVNLANQELKSIDVSSLLELETLEIQGNQIKQLDLKSNSKLQSLRAANNSIKRLELQNNNVLESLFVSSNNLQSLDLSQTPNIKALQLNNNQIKSLDAPKANGLKRLLADNNHLSSLAISSLSFPTQLSFKNNPLNSESIKQLRQQFWAEYADLSDEVIFSQKPNFPIFALETQDFPDPLFKKCVEQALREKQLNTPDEIKRLDCSYQDITRLEGLQLLTGLESLVLQGINTTEVPLSNHRSLSSVMISELPLAALDLSQLPSLKTVGVSRNQLLRSLKLPESHSIERITAEHNALQSLWVHTGKSLKSLNLQNNQLEQINFGQLDNLVRLDISDNRLKQVDVRPLTSLNKLIIAKNQLSKIDLSQNLKLQDLYLPFNQLVSLDLKSNEQIEELILFNNPLEIPDLAHLNRLKTIAVDKTQFENMIIRKMHLKFNQEPQSNESIIILSKK